MSIDHKLSRQAPEAAPDESLRQEVDAARRRIALLEEEVRSLAAERDLYRNSTSYRFGQALLKPLGFVRDLALGKRRVHASLRDSESSSAASTDILVVCHDTSMSTGSPRPALGYFEEMKSRGASIRLLALPRWDPSMTARKPLPPAKRTIINSIASLRWRVVREHLEQDQTGVALYLHETAWAMEKFKSLCPEGYATLRRVAPDLHMLAVSEGQKKYFQKEHGARRVTVIRNVTQNANLDPAQVRQGPAEDPHPLIIMVGTIQARKGVELFSLVADMAKEHGKPWRFQWIGHEIGDRLYQSDNVDWAGVLKGEALASAYKQASLFFLPSMDDPFPLASLEAMSYGVNAVCYREVGTAEIIGGLPGSASFDYYSAEHAFSAIEKALQTPSEGRPIFDLVKPLVDPAHFANVVNRAIGHEAASR